MRWLAALLVVVGCSGLNPEPRPYRACHETMQGGRLLHDVGTVVAVEVIDGEKVYVFRSAYWGREIQVSTVNRMCRLVATMDDLTLSPYAQPPHE